MKFGMRTPSLKKSIKARTTGKAKRAVKTNSIIKYKDQAITVTQLLLGLYLCIFINIFSRKEICTQYKV